jgi:sugar phosphate permease
MGQWGAGYYIASLQICFLLARSTVAFNFNFSSPAVCCFVITIVATTRLSTAPSRMGDGDRSSVDD